MTTHSTRMLILGSGPAGLSAAIYGARAGMQPIVVQGIQPGGQLTTTTDVENYPGFADVIQGPWLMEQMQKQAEHVGARMMWDTITEVDLTQRPFRLIGDGGDVYEGEVLVIATGAQAIALDLRQHVAERGGVGGLLAGFLGPLFVADAGKRLAQAARFGVRGRRWIVACAMMVANRGHAPFDCAWLKTRRGLVGDERGYLFRMCRHRHEAARATPVGVDDPVRAIGAMGGSGARGFLVGGRAFEILVEHGKHRGVGRQRR